MSQVTRQKVDMKKEKVEEKFANAKQKMHLIHGEKKEKINITKDGIFFNLISVLEIFHFNIFILFKLYNSETKY